MGWTESWVKQGANLGGRKFVGNGFLDLAKTQSKSKERRQSIEASIRHTRRKREKRVKSRKRSQMKNRVKGKIVSHLRIEGGNVSRPLKKNSRKKGGATEECQQRNSRGKTEPNKIRNLWGGNRWRGRGLKITEFRAT